MEFYKYQGAGNDFVIVDNMDLHLGEKQELAASICHRRFGAGADGFIAAEPSDNSDVKMAFYNSDGSIAGMCGNGIRCFSKFVADRGIVEGNHFTVETGDGQKVIDILETAPAVTRVKVDMGSCGEIRSYDGLSIYPEAKAYFTHIGVPHTVIVCSTQGGTMEELDALAMDHGHDVEFAEEFMPAHTNVNFIQQAGKDHILCSTWERGAGKTLACGTGACSSAYIAHTQLGMGASVRVTMPGGEVTVSFDDNGTVYMEGTAVLTYVANTLED